ncbi:hypothetical protein WG66_007496 [Moniliophthora roreri]|nr:hypothetical protein WG66_007496 [Moniliophthora roreri]
MQSLSFTSGQQPTITPPQPTRSTRPHAYGFLLSDDYLEELRRERDLSHPYELITSMSWQLQDLWPNTRSGLVDDRSGRISYALVLPTNKNFALTNKLPTEVQVQQMKKALGVSIEPQWYRCNWDDMCKF